MGYVLKILMWILISMIITAAVGAAILIPIWKALVSVTEVQTIVNGILGVVKNVWDGGVNIRAVIVNLAYQIVDLLKEISTQAGLATGLAFSVVFLYMLYSFIMGLSYYTIADIINKLM